MAELTHLDPEGRPVMVDVSAKAVTRRIAVAAGYLELDAPAAEALAKGGGPKGDPWSVARIGAVGGVKRTSDLIPLAHPLAIEAVDVIHHWDPATRRAWLRVQVSCEGRTGIEMEALAGVTVGLLVLYDLHPDDLETRGFASAAVHPKVKAIGYGEIVDLIMNDYEKTAWL